MKFISCKCCFIVEVHVVVVVVGLIVVVGVVAAVISYLCLLGSLTSRLAQFLTGSVAH